MQFTVGKEPLIQGLQRILGAVDKKQLQPVLSQIQVAVGPAGLSLCATDGDIELETSIAGVTITQVAEAGSILIPARKWIDLTRNLPDGVQITVTHAEAQTFIVAKPHTFRLVSLAGTARLPRFTDLTAEWEPLASVAMSDLKQLLDLTRFAMAEADVRPYLNGVLLKVLPDGLELVATDGHRLAQASRAIGVTGTGGTPSDVPQRIGDTVQILLPRRAVLELPRLLDGAGIVQILQRDRLIRLVLPHTTLTARRLEGQYPEYAATLRCTETPYALIDREALRHVLQSVSVLLSERSPGALLHFADHALQVRVRNTDRDEADTRLLIHYDGPALEVALNMWYVLEYLAILKCAQIRIFIRNATGAVCIQGVDPQQATYAVMPMRL